MPPIQPDIGREYVVPGKAVRGPAIVADAQALGHAVRAPVKAPATTPAILAPDTTEYSSTVCDSPGVYPVAIELLGESSRSPKKGALAPATV